MFVTTDRSNHCDPVLFPENRFDPKSVKDILKNNNGLDSPELSKNLREASYIKVFKAIWSEKNKERRLDFLRNNAGLHAPLLFELGMAEVAKELPKVQKDYNDEAMKEKIREAVAVAMSYFTAASKRVFQDALAVNDHSLEDAGLVMFMIYNKGLSDLLNNRTGKNWEDFYSKELSKGKEKAKVKEIFQKTLTESLPNPTWVGKHGLSYTFSGRVELYPYNEAKEKQNNCAKKIIEAFDKI
jgi:hypothetical protein